MNLFRQMAHLLSAGGNRKTVSIGIVGRPNVGKSSIINVLKSKLVCKSAPLAGETKVWQ